MRNDTTYRIRANFSRPGDTTAYSANDAVNNSTTAPAPLEFQNIGQNLGGSGFILGARLVKSSNTTTNASFRLWLFGQSVTPQNDNAQQTILYTNKDKRLGYIDFTLTTEGTGSDCAEGQAFNVNIPFACQGDSKSIYGLLEAKAAYTPANGESFYVELCVERN